MSFIIYFIFIMCLGERTVLWEGGPKGAPISVVTGNGRYGAVSRTCQLRGTRPRQLVAVTCSGPPHTHRIAGSSISQPSDLQLLLFNARSINNKTSLIHDLIVDEAADLACITETWVSDLGGINLSQLCPPGYSVQHLGRSEGRGGGIAVVYRSSIPLVRHPIQMANGLECLHITLGQRDRLGILLVYRPPCCPTASLTQLTEVVSDLLLRSPKLLVLGDLNIHAEAALSLAAQDFMTCMTAMGLSQFVTGPTHVLGHTLDLIFATGLGDGDLRVRDFSSIPLSWSDHRLLRFRLTLFSPLCKGGGPIKMVRPRRLMNPEGFLMALGNFPADRIDGPVETMAMLWNTEMARAVDTIAPVRPLRCRAQLAPWFTPELRVMKQERRRLECKWRRTPDGCNHALTFLINMGRFPVGLGTLG
ncbi:uncharacterized protein LOC133376492 [Rhineura floridana]|uniref:uncharacterized protein LOC133376492 n=1 Tax=Rhineura floridana TaxID=261503 RepID=UPI002AC80564|nr:uncharacterized protein LOC133376492 [Rhineura floridana]